MRFQVKDTSAQFVESMTKRSQNITFASAVALTRTAQKVKSAQIDLMAQKLDRPTRFTLNSLMIRPATKTKLEAVVQTKEGFNSNPAAFWLSPLIYGGQRDRKRSESFLDSYWTPAKAAPLDAFGNVPGPTIKKVLSQLKKGDAFQQATNSRRSKAKRKAEAYFIQNGVVFQKKAGAEKPTPFLLLVKKVPTYRKFLPWYETAQEVIDQTLPAEFYKALDEFPAR